MAIGFKFPFTRATGSLGYFAVTEDELSAVRENLKSLLSTNWGERVMNYSFGCNLIEFLFENEGTDVLREKITDRIYSQVARWMPFVSLDDVQVLFPSDSQDVPEHVISVHLEFRISSRPDLSSVLDYDVAAGRS